MKKILSMMLSLVLLLNLSITVFAKEDTVASASDAQSATGQGMTDTGIADPQEQPEMISETGEDSVINIEITWGTMKFTYSDKTENYVEEGWICADGANTVKVKNNGTVSVKAECSYEQLESYASIVGEIHGEPKILSEKGETTFNLIFYNTPDAVLNGVEIGSVTVTITNADNQSNAVALAGKHAEKTENGTDDKKPVLDETFTEATGSNTIRITEENDKISNVTDNEETIR